MTEIGEIVSSKGTAPPAGNTPAPKKCECGVTSATITNATMFDNGRQFGHRFDFVSTMTYTAGTAGRCDCTLEWWERTNVPAVPGHRPNVWQELYSHYSVSPTFDPWKNRAIPCPGGGTLTVTIMDPPALGIRPGRTVTRTLEFRLVIKECAARGTTSVSATARQVLVMINGQPQPSQSSFTTP
jgi:hypothetical protein